MENEKAASPTNDKPLKHVKRVRSKGHEYLYFHNGRDATDGPRYERLPEDPAEFRKAYAARLEARRERERLPKDVSAMIRQYQLSDRFRSLAQPTQVVYQKFISRLEGEFGNRPVGKISAAELAELADTLGKPSRRVFLKVAGVVHTWAIQQGFLTLNPVEGIDTPKRPSERIYFIGAGEGYPIKIGRAVSPERRCAELQTANPYRLAVMVSFEAANGVVEERRLHERFAAYRLHREWFSPHPDILEEIERLRADRKEDR